MEINGCNLMAYSLGHICRLPPGSAKRRKTRLATAGCPPPSGARSRVSARLWRRQCRASQALRRRQSGVIPDPPPTPAPSSRPEGTGTSGMILAGQGLLEGCCRCPRLGPCPRERGKGREKVVRCVGGWRTTTAWTWEKWTFLGSVIRSASKMVVGDGGVIG